MVRDSGSWGYSWCYWGDVRMSEQEYDPEATTPQHCPNCGGVALPRYSVKKDKWEWLCCTNWGDCDEEGIRFNYFVESKDLLNLALLRVLKELKQALVEL